MIKPRFPQGKGNSTTWTACALRYRKSLQSRSNALPPCTRFLALLLAHRRGAASLSIPRGCGKPVLSGISNNSSQRLQGTATALVFCTFPPQRESRKVKEPLLHPAELPKMSAKSCPRPWGCRGPHLVQVLQAGDGRAAPFLGCV